MYAENEDVPQTRQLVLSWLAQRSNNFLKAVDKKEMSCQTNQNNGIKICPELQN